MTTSHIKDKSGQAFPLSYEGPKTFDNPTGRHAEPGMTLRDYFAAKAMEAMITKSSGQDATGGAAGVPVIAKYAYEYADAMLLERAK